MEVRESPPGFVHAKMFVSDNTTAVVGTTNVDFRSFYLHFECGTLLYGAPALETLLEDMDGIMEKSWQVTRSDWEHRPLLHRVFPSTKEDAALAESLSANICANFLGLGNAATPMGIQAAQRMKRGGTATDELCRLIVLNTASIQLIPANVSAVRSALGCATPFDILPAVWVTSLCSAGLGVTAAWVLGKVWRK